MQNVKSISTNSVFSKKDVIANLEKPLFRVKGYAIATFGISTKYGENTGFRGQFVAVNLLTGEVFESEAVFLPKSETKNIEKLLMEGGQEVVVDMFIKATKSDKNSAGYAWIADFPKTEAQVNRFEALKLEAQADAAKLLPSPKKKA